MNKEAIEALGKIQDYKELKSGIFTWEFTWIDSEDSEDKTEVFYQMSEFYVPESARGVRWNDPEFAITWPEDERVILIKDQNIADFRPNE